MNIIVNAFKRLVFESKHCPDIDVDYESDTDDKDDFDFQIPREVTPRNLIPDHGIDTLFNNEYEQLDMPDLECEESAAQTRKQRAARLKLLTPSQMLSRLAFFLAQLKAGNNSKTFKNEIRQIVFFVQIKKLTKDL